MVFFFGAGFSTAFFGIAIGGGLLAIFGSAMTIAAGGGAVITGGGGGGAIADAIGATGARGGGDTGTDGVIACVIAGSVVAGSSVVGGAGNIGLGGNDAVFWLIVLLDKIAARG